MKKVTSILEVFHIDEMEFNKLLISILMMNTHILLIEKLVIQSLVMFLLNFKTQLTTFLKDTRDHKVY